MFDVEHIKSLIVTGETYTIEFKSDFDWSDERKKIKYVKAMIGLHNNEGGFLLFGVEDDGTIIGIGKEFDKLDNADITKAINRYF